MPRIDAHQHFWRYRPDTHAWIGDSMASLKRDFLPGDVLPLMRAAGYDGCVAVQAQQTVAETEWLLDLADQHPFILGVVGWVDLCSPDVAYTLARLARRPRLRGIRHIVQDEPDDRFMLRADFQRGIAALAPHGLTYDVLIHPRHLPAATELCRRFPAQRFVLDHLAKPFIKAGQREPWATDLAALARLPNVQCKISGLVTEANWAAWTVADLRPYVAVAFDLFGPGRLMIGSDWPVSTLASDYVRLMRAMESLLPSGAHVPEAAAAFYGLQDRPTSARA
jgi:L-fuconolactonase